MPVESLVRKFEHVRFEPSGMTRNPDIPIAKSLVDYIFRWLAMEFVPGYRAANAPKRAEEEARGIEAALDAEAADARAARRRARSADPDDKNGNGHGPRIEPDTAQPFDYGSGSKATGRRPRPQRRRHGPTARTDGHRANLRLAIVADPLSQQGTNMQADAPACDVCGSITVRSGTCYKCLNCGNSMGCS